MSLDPGELRHRVTFRKNTPVQDSNGDTVDDWADYATVWAGWEPVSVRDFIQSGANQSQISARCKVRYRDDLTADMQVVHRGRTYQLGEALPDKESGLEYLTIPCSLLIE